MSANDDSSVRVAVRIRPQIASEVIDMCRVCTRVTPDEPQVTLGQDKSFTFDHVFDTNATQAQLFTTCVEALVSGALDGYNATVLAYGQTGSGKTYTMGTGFEVENNEETVGIIPRAIRLLFAGIERRVEEAKSRALIPPEFKVLAQFMELYNEEIIDLFDPVRDHYGSKSPSGLRITEDGGGGVRVADATCKPVRDAADALACLRLGALARTTASTNMNAASSRSHAVFTLHLKQQRLVRSEDPDADIDASGETTNEFETLTAKFHFVDLAGSERLKRTGATGERAREGISINCGLLALGNVISALGDKSKKVTHVPYRDSKLTRLLQDSLGGNSQTVMIACVSPSDRDFMETLNTLKYANRARNIKNKLVVNQDKSSRTISLLRQEVAQLQLELLEFKQGKRILTESGEDGIADVCHENRVLQSELENLRTRVKALQGTVDQLSRKNTELLAEKALGQWVRPDDTGETQECGLTTLIQGYVQEIEGLRAKLLEANSMYDALKKGISQRQHTNSMSRSFMLSPDRSLLDKSSSIINEAKKELYKEKELLARSMGELEFQRKMSQSMTSPAAEESMGERERAEGESADDSDRSDDSDSHSESEDSESKVCAALGAELATLSGDIDMKQRLVEELELSQRRLHSMQRHYEDKLVALHNQIKATQLERDKVLHSYNSQVAPPSDKMKRVKEDYERKLSDMSRELRRLQSAQREHARLLRAQSNTEQQIQSVRAELHEMKRNKVKLLNKMKEESARHKAAEARRAREVAQLKKESRKNANIIRTLENDRRLKEQVLRRKQEEVSLLRRGHRDKLSSMAAGRKRERASRKQAVHKWSALEKALMRATLNRQAIGELECDMERQIAERERLCREREVLKRKVASSNAAPHLASELDSLHANIAYLQETIAEAQQQIMQIEETKESGGGEEAELSALVSEIGSEESSFVLDRLVALVLQHGYNAARHHKQLQDTRAKLHQLEMDQERTESALRLAAESSDFSLDFDTRASPASPARDPAPARVAALPHISSGTSTRSVSPVDSTLIELRNDAKKLSSLANGIHDTSPEERQPFARNSNVRGSVRLRDLGVYPGVSTDKSEDPMTQSMLVEPTHRGQPLARVPSAPGSLKGLMPLVMPRTAPSPLSARKSFSPAHSPIYPPGEVPPSPRTQRRQPLLKPASVFLTDLLIIED